MTRLTEEQIKEKKNFIENYKLTSNASTASTVDANANVSMKTVSTLGTELLKDFNIQINRSTMYDYIEKMFSPDDARKYIESLEEHSLYKNDETCQTPATPYCVSISLFPFLEHGMRTMGGESGAPKHLESFCGSFINLVFATSSQFSGACLHRDQELLLKSDDAGARFTRIGGFVSGFDLDRKHAEGSDVWEYANLEGKGYSVFEDGKFVEVKKVFRRPYKEKIYRITTESGLRATVSKDHRFRTVAGTEVAAENLSVGDMLSCNRNLRDAIDRSSSSYFLGRKRIWTEEQDINYKYGFLESLSFREESGDLVIRTSNREIMERALAFLSEMFCPAKVETVHMLGEEFYRVQVPSGLFEGFPKEDRIKEIETFMNDDAFVYELETETHWYNCGGFITHNCAVVEFLLYFHYFAVKDYGKDYLKTHPELVAGKLQHVIYSLNMPAAARGFQAVFLNLSVFDRYFYDSMFGHFYFPDGTHFDYDDGFGDLQKFFLEWLLEERKKALLTFPVLTEASLNENGKPKDKEWAEMIADLRSRGLSLFSYNDDNAAALASCCLRGHELIEVQKNGKTYRMPLSGFVNSFSDEPTFENVFDTGYETLSLNTKTGKTETTRITGILKRPYYGVMVRISSGGRTIETTPDHIFPVYDKETSLSTEVPAMTIAENPNRYKVAFLR